VIDRYGNRELLYLDAEIGSMCPTPLRPTPVPPVLNSAVAQGASEDEDLGQFTVSDVYRGLPRTVPRGTVKYLRVCGEVRSELARLSNGEYRADHEPFQDWYATPIHKVSGPQGWVHYFDCRYNVSHTKADAGSFGTLKSKLWKVLDEGHYDAALSQSQRRAVKCWIDLNCPLWGDYQLRSDRPIATALSPP